MGSFELKNSKIFKLILRTRVIEGHLGPNLKKKKGGPQIASSEARGLEEDTVSPIASSKARGSEEEIGPSIPSSEAGGLGEETSPQIASREARG